MKTLMKISALFLVALLGFSSSFALAKDAESPASLRAEAATLYERADALTEQAARMEAEAPEVRSRGVDAGDVRSRGFGSHQCVMDCLNTNAGIYACRRACGAY